MKEKITRSLQQNYHISLKDRFLMATFIETSVVDADEDPAVTFLSFKEKLDKGFYAAYPHMITPEIRSQLPQAPIDKRPVPSPEKVEVIEVDKITPEQQEETTLREISECTNIGSLDSYKYFVKGKPKLQAAYDEKLTELTK